VIALGIAASIWLCLARPEEAGSAGGRAEAEGRSIRSPNPLGELNAAIKAEEAGDNRMASDLLEEASREAPVWTLPKLELAQIDLKLGQAQPARQLATDAVRIDAASPRAWHLLALADDALGDAAGAENADSHAVQLRPDYLEAKQHLAQVLWNEGKKDPALEQYVQLVALNPHDTSLLALLATAEEEAGHVVAAEQALRTLAEIQPEAVAWHRRLARLLEGEGKGAEAAAELEKVTRLSGAQKARRLRPLLPSKR
jgi:predicted Zn-dependent protease